ncbi:hypothetical protein JVT61DRAFT_6308 [Boletus reticuloceps]|uniref:Uncharacterized protein n=1 Tax=Boletus reticuloceps TaxID=495285 RepID=A0A8I2YK60_9AGAM|nr:hypothetical protein JVT61DRAFT_6308 [Boletus reticuloceps]
MPHHFKRYPGLSKSIYVHSFKDGVRRTTTLRPGKRVERLRRIKVQHALEVQGLSPADQDTVDRMFEDQAMDVCYDEPLPNNPLDLDYEDVESDDDNEGFSSLAKPVPGWHPIDARTRRDRVNIQLSQWDAQMPRLVEGYLEYRSCESDQLGFPEMQPATEEPVDDPSGTIRNVELIDLFGKLPALFA